MAEIQSLARGLEILNRMAQNPEGLSVTVLAEEMGLDKASASRLLSTLAAYGYAEKDLITRRYSLGPQVMTLSKSLLSRLHLREVAKPYLRQLMSMTGECAHIGILAQDKVLYIDQVESPASLRVNAEIGHLAPLHCTALGKVLLAFSYIPLPESLDKLTQNTIVSHGRLKKELETIRENGFAIDDEEYDTGVRCIAAPIFDFRDKVVGAIGVSGPTTRMTPEVLPVVIRSVLEIGQAVSDKMRFDTEQK